MLVMHNCYVKTFGNFHLEIILKSRFLSNRFERYKTSEGNNQYAVAGYTTVYQYYAYPVSSRS